MALETPACGSAKDKPEFRPTARVLLIDDRDRILLMRVTTPNDPDIRLWITPGGGLDAGETHEDAALRELYEETGLRDVKLGPCIWTRRHVWQWEARWIGSDERFYLLRVPTFDAAPTAPDEWEMQYVHEQRWWSVPEMIASRDTEIFVPRAMPELLLPLLAGTVPEQPIEVGA